MSAPVGWHEQPDGKERFWDGTAWTAEFRQVGQTDLAPDAKPDDNPISVDDIASSSVRSRKHWMGYPATAALSLILGLAIGNAGSTNDKVAAAATSATSNGSVSPSTSDGTTPSPSESSDAEEAMFTPDKQDFSLGVKVLKKACFGSAGCNVTYRIVPNYEGVAELPDSGTVEVTYKIEGGEDPMINTFTIEGSQASYDSEEMVETASSKTKLNAVVTDVAYQP